jgi:hypothetical protein
VRVVSFAKGELPCPWHKVQRTQFVNVSSTEENARFIDHARPIFVFAKTLPHPSSTVAATSGTNGISVIPGYLSVSSIDCLEETLSPSSPTSPYLPAVAHSLAGVGAHLNNGDKFDNQPALLGPATEDTEKLNDNDSIDLEALCASAMGISDIIRKHNENVWAFIQKRRDTSAID